MPRRAVPAVWGERAHRWRRLVLLCWLRHSWGCSSAILRAARGLVSRKPAAVTSLPTPKCPHPKTRTGGNSTSWRWAHCKVCKAKLWSWDTETGSVQVKLEDRLDVMDPETRRQLPSAVWQRACRVAGKDPKETQQDGKLTAPRKEKAQVNWVKHFDLIRRCVDQEITEKYLEDVLVASGEDPEMVKLSVIEVRKVRAAERAGQARGSEDVTMTQEPTETSPPGMARTSSWSEVSMAEHPDLTFV